MKIPGLPTLTVAGYSAGWAVVRRVPGAFGWPAFAAAADAAAIRGGKSVERLRSNYARVTGLPSSELDELVRAGMRSYARYWFDVFRLNGKSPAWIEKNFVIPNEALIFDALAEGRGVILVLGHLGNWDHAGAWLTGRGVPFTTVAERLEPTELFDRFVEFRESLGMEVIALTGGERPPFEILADRLRDGRCLCLLADRDLSAHGVPVNFFDAVATMPAGPARLALETGAVLLPTTLWYDEKWCVHAHIDDPVPHTDVATMTQHVADRFARTIAEHPQDWHMLQRLWQADLEPRRRSATGTSE
jgi:KDO2-lipid IV(A) lauroyltransferase